MCIQAISHTLQSVVDLVLQREDKFGFYNRSRLLSLNWLLKIHLVLLRVVRRLRSLLRRNRPRAHHVQRPRRGGGGWLGMWFYSQCIPPSLS